MAFNWDKFMETIMVGLKMMIQQEYWGQREEKLAGRRKEEYDYQQEAEMDVKREERTYQEGRDVVEHDQAKTLVRLRTDEAKRLTKWQTQYQSDLAGAMGNPALVNQWTMAAQSQEPESNVFRLRAGLQQKVLADVKGGLTEFSSQQQEIFNTLPQQVKGDINTLMHTQRQKNLEFESRQDLYDAMTKNYKASTRRSEALAKAAENKNALTPEQMIKLRKDHANALASKPKIMKEAMDIKLRLDAVKDNPEQTTMYMSILQAHQASLQQNESQIAQYERLFNPQPIVDRTQKRPPSVTNVQTTTTPKSNIFQKGVKAIRGTKAGKEIFDGITKGGGKFIDNVIYQFKSQSGQRFDRLFKKHGISKNVMVYKEDETDELREAWKKNPGIEALVFDKKSRLWYFVTRDKVPGLIQIDDLSNLYDNLF